jgi:hypothetical protein
MTLSDGADGASKVVNVIVGMPSVDPIVHSCTVGALLIALLVSELACFLTWAFQETAERIAITVVKRTKVKEALVQSEALL